MASSCGSSYASSLETTNYARICRIVVEVLRDILWLVLTNEILPADLPQKVQIDIKKLGNLNLKIKTWLCGISPPSTKIPSAENFDVSSLYTLIRNLCSQVPAPSTQWGQIPPAGGITLGDDIERVREFRNTLYGHATQAKIETADFNKLCIEIKDVATRFDAYFCSLPKAMKCNFQCEIDTILTCFMDKSLEDDYIDKMKEIAILSDVKEIKEDLKSRSCRTRDMEKEMLQGMEGKICIIKCYADLKRELERGIMMDIAKDLFQKEKHQDVLENIAKAGTRRLCIDQLLKRVLQLEASRLKIFFDLLKKKHPEGAQKLAEIKVAEKDRENFTKVSESIKMAPHRIQKDLKFEQLDVEFFRCYLQDMPEKVDQIADVLLSQFHISIRDHSQLMTDNDPVKKIHALLKKIQSCNFDSDSEVQRVLGSKLYQKWQSFRDDGSRQGKEEDMAHSLEEGKEEDMAHSLEEGLENQGIWHYILERIQSSKEYLIEHFRGLRVHFMQESRGSLVLKFVTMDNFDVKLLEPEAVKSKIWDMIKTLWPEYQDILKEPVHLTIFLKPLSNTGSAEIYFYLETKTEKEEFYCMKLRSHDKQYFLEEMGPVSLTNWMRNTLQLDEDTKTKLEDLRSRKDLSRRKKMKILLNLVESLGNGYELLEKYCEEHDTFLYDKVFKKHRQMMVEENPDGAQQYEFSEEGLQRLSSTWIDFTVDPKEKDKGEDVSDSFIDEKHALEKENAGNSHEPSQSTKEKKMEERQKEDGAYCGLYLARGAPKYSSAKPIHQSKSSNAVLEGTGDKYNNTSNLISRMSSVSLQGTEYVLKEHFDACITYCEADETDAYKFKDHLEKLDLGHGEHPKICLYTEEKVWGPTKLTEKVKFVCKHCTLIFVYLSKRCSEDEYADFFQKEVIMATIKKSRVRPVLSDKDCIIPSGLNNAPKIEYYKQESRSYKNNILSLFEMHKSERLRREKERIESILSTF